MKIVYIDASTRLSVETVVCLGFFDGVHIGHAQLIARAQAIAAENAWHTCVHTFETMPARVLRPQADVLELTPLAEKAALLASAGVEILAVSQFLETMPMRAEAFFDEILLQALHARHIVAGFHHHFGFQGEGDVEMLKAYCARAGVGLDIIAPVTMPDGELVSSTAIRKAIRDGDRGKAERMLGRSLSII